MYQFVDSCLLCVVFGNGGSFLQPINDLFQSSRIEPSDAVDLFGDYTVAFYQLRVQPVHNGLAVGGVFHLGIELFCLFLSNTAVVIVACRRCYKVYARCLIGLLGIQFRVEDNG